MLFRSEAQGAFAAVGNEGGGEAAEVVPGHRITLAVSQAPIVGGEDVRDAVGGQGDGNGGGWVG